MAVLGERVSWTPSSRVFRAWIKGNADRYAATYRAGRLPPPETRPGGCWREDAISDANVVSRRLKVRGAAKELLLLIVETRCSLEDETPMSRAAFAQALGCTERTIQRSLDTLEGHSLIAVRRDRPGKTGRLTGITVIFPYIKQLREAPVLPTASYAPGSRVKAGTLPAPSRARVIPAVPTARPGETFLSPQAPPLNPPTDTNDQPGGTAKRMTDLWTTRHPLLTRAAPKGPNQTATAGFGGGPIASGSPFDELGLPLGPPG